MEARGVELLVPSDAPSRGTWGREPWRAVALGAAVFAALFYFSAYVCDDAFITFRCVDNFCRGHGLRWNAGERVQAFTSPLHTLLLSTFYSFVRDASEVPNPDRAYWLAMLLSFAISAITLLLVLRRRGANSWAMLAILMSSQAFVTFCSSGLETPLSYLIVTVFYVAFLRPGFLSSDRDYLFGFVWAGLALLNRLDLVLLFLPAMIYIFVTGWRRMGWRIARLALAGLSPLAAWFAFSLCYYGFVLPNSYYAKLGLDVPRSALAAMGADYLLQNLRQDPVTLLVCLAAVVLCWSDRRSRLAGMAVATYVLYVCAIGGDFLGFRFLALPFLLSVIVVFTRLQRGTGLPGRSRLYAVFGGLAYGLLVPSSPLRAFRDPPAARDVAFYYRASGLARWSPGARFPFAPFLNVKGPMNCRRLHASEPSVPVWGDGLNGFCRGPQSSLVDPHGISDALMARLSLPIASPFKPGHLAKPVPVGYPASLLMHDNRIVDPELKVFYEGLRTVIAGPLWTRERWRTIWQMNFTPAARYREPYLAYPTIPDWMRENANDLLRQ